MSHLAQPLADRPVVSPYTPNRRWPTLDQVESTAWESLGYIDVTAEHHGEYLSTFNHSASSQEGDSANVGVLACLLLGSLRNSFPLPDVPESEGPVVLVHTNQMVRVESPVTIASRVNLLGRLTARSEKQTYLYEGWLLDKSTTPLVFSSFYIRIFPVERMAGQ